MPDLSGLAGLAGGFAGGLPQAQGAWQEVQRRQLELDAIKRQLAAETAAGGALGDTGNLPTSQPLPSAPPSAPPAGGPSPIPLRQVAAAPGFVPANAQAATATPSAPAAAAPGGMAGPGVTAQPPMPLGGTLSIEQLAQRIRQRNPSIDGATLFEAVKQASSLLNPFEKQMLQFYERQLALASREKIATQQVEGRKDVAELGAQSREKVANIGATSRETVATQRLNTVSANTKYVQGQIADRLSKAGGVKEAQRIATAHLNALKAERQTILDQARETGGVTTPEQTQALNAANKAIADFQRQNAKLIGGGETAGGAVTAPAATTGGWSAITPP